MVRELLQVKNYVDGGDKDTSFHGIEISEYTLTLNRMGDSTLEATIMYPICLDDEWDGRQYVTIRGEKYFVYATPDSSKSSDDARYKHEVTFRAEKSILSTIYFYDVVPTTVDSITAQKPYSNSTTVTFYGNIQEFADRMNCALLYANVGDSILNTRTHLTEADINNKSIVGDGYCVVVDTSTDTFDRETSVELSFEDTYIWEALTQAYEAFEIPFEIRGKKIIFCAEPQVLTRKFKYGQDDSLVSVKKTNANNQVINRISFKGSEDNIPYYYPNESDYGHLEIKVGLANKYLTKSDFSIEYVNRLVSKATPESDITIHCKAAISEMIYVKDFTYKTSSDKEFTSTRPNPPEREYKYEIQVEGKLKINRKSTCTLQSIVATIYNLNTTQGTTYYLSNGYVKDLIFYLEGESPDYPSYRFDHASSSMVMGEMYPGNYMVRFTVTFPVQTRPTTFEMSQVGIYSSTIIDEKYVTVDGKTYDSLADLGIGCAKEIIPEMDGETLQWYIAEAKMPSQTNLMPPLYRQTKGAERFYNAVNGKYIDPDTGEPYIFPNPYEEGAPSEYILSDDTIKPTIAGIVNEQGQLFGEIADIAYDEDDNDSLKADVDEDEDTDSANYEHSFFYIKLNIFNGDRGFDLFDAASQTDSMTLQMTSGNCNGCKFKIQASQFTNEFGKYYYKNPVLVKSANGDIVDGSYSDKVIDGTIYESKLQSFQQDTTKNSIWICVQKDAETFGVIMPNASNNYKPAIGDTFNIINIDLPQTYIDEAETLGEQTAIRYMFDNNSESFSFDVSCSRVYFTENPSVLEEIDEYKKVIIDYDDKDWEQYISTVTITCKDSEVLPEIALTLSQELSVSQSFTQSVADRAISLIANAMTYGNTYYGSTSLGLSVTLAKRMFLSKLGADVASGHITFEQGLTAMQSIVAEKGIVANGAIQFGKTFISGLIGQGGRIDENGRGELRSLRLWETLEVPELRYNSVSVYTGIRWDTFGAGLIESVETTGDSTGIVNLKLEQGQIGAIAVDDLCMGIFHNEGGENSLETTDSKTGDFTFAGFQTCYFRITKILDATNSSFEYTLRSGFTVHPQAQMSFACYANPNDTSRQWCTYTTPTYSIGLRDMTTWNFSEENVYRISGLLDGFSLNGKSFEGVGDVLGNAYIYGRIEQFENAPLELKVNIVGNNYTIAEGETLSIECTLTKGWQDLTSEVQTWTIERDTGDSQADAQWQNLDKVSAFAGSIQLEYSDISSSDDIDSAMFTITAVTSDSQKIQAKIQ
jgi:hypothetical protein